jgi:GTP cyclohydrolase II
LADHGARNVVLRGLAAFSRDGLAPFVDPEVQGPVPPPGVEANPAGADADAAIRLVKIARLLPAAVAAPLTDADSQRWAAAHDVLIVDTTAIAAHDRAQAEDLRIVGEARVPLVDSENCRIVTFRPGDAGAEHLAIVIGDIDPSRPVLTRLHSECFTGDLLGSLRCDCGDQLRGAIQTIAAHGSGVLLYLAQEGRGIGLVNKLRAYRLQDFGYDTVDANEQLGFDDDERIYLPAVQMLRQLGVARVRLLTNNPAKVGALARHGIEVTERVPLVMPSNDHNRGYLTTKARRSGHLL